MLDNRLTQLAYIIRKAFEEIADITKSPDDLCGFCQRASIQFFLKAKDMGFNVKLAVACGHVYNTYESYMIDITATQFDISERVLIAKKEGRQIKHWALINNEISSLKELNKISWETPSDEIEFDSKVVEKYINNIQIETQLR